MYKNALGLCKAGDEWSPDEDKRFQQPILAAAGVHPRAPRGFIGTRKLGLGLRIDCGFGRDYVKLANDLNKNGEHNAIGRPWNHQQVRAFVQAFLPQSN